MPAAAIGSASPNSQQVTAVFTIGIDYGTNSVRTLVVRCSDGAEFASHVVDYPSGHQGILLDPSDHLLARQHPGDYLVGLERSVKGALAAASGKPGFSVAQVVGIGVDSTGSSPIPVDRSNAALAMTEEWRANLAAQCWLWKDHTSWREAERITELTIAGGFATCAATRWCSGYGRSLRRSASSSGRARIATTLPGRMPSLRSRAAMRRTESASSA